MRALGGVVLLAAIGTTSGSRELGAGVKSSVSLPLIVGINVATINNWDGGRPFSNLIYGSSWQMRNTRTYGPYEDVPATALDANGWVKSAPEGYKVLRPLSTPLEGGEFLCRHDGSGTLVVDGPSVRDVRVSSGHTEFRLVSTHPQQFSATISFTINPTNYIRNIDCRERKVPRTQIISTGILSALKGFEVIRLMKWQVATEANTRIAWATRNKPFDGDFLKNDGVPIELLIDLSNAADADPWLTVPWNADDDYVLRFATYVRDHLKSGHRVYVEVSNEVWNGGYAVSRQAAAEAKSERLPSASNSGAGSALERYAERTKSVLGIWSGVFRGQRQRLVRVASFQHVSPATTDQMLRYSDLFRSVDALATAPYFGYEITDRMTVDEVFAALPRQVSEAVSTGIKQKQIAQKYGLRYITYEAGQHIVLADDLALQKRIQRDPRMADIYAQFLRSWRAQVGDNLNLFALSGPISEYGAWGLSEYVGQPANEAPKMRAVRGFLRSARAGPRDRLAINVHRRASDPARR